MASIKQKCKRVVAVRNSMGMSFKYQCPVGRVDRKREGKTLEIGFGSNKSVTLDGYGLRVLKRLLKDCGEIGKRVDPRRTKVVELGPK